MPLHSWYHEGFLPADAMERAIKWEDDLRKKADEERRAKEQEEKLHSSSSKPKSASGGDGNKAVVLERSPTLRYSEGTNRPQPGDTKEKQHRVVWRRTVTTKTRTRRCLGLRRRIIQWRTRRRRRRRRGADAER